MNHRRPLPIVDAREGARSDTSPSSRGPLLDRTTEALSMTGPIARALSASGIAPEARPGQVEMARAVAQAIEGERTLLCEAGTGTGKTLAYLVPAILSGRRVVVSTATKALQEQIFTKDVPLLARHLGVSFDAALMKGLGNYLCRRRLQEAVASLEGFASEGALSKLAAWAADSETGDRAELSWLRDDDPAWRDVQSGSDTRIGKGCPYDDTCFVTRMRSEAQKARLVVVNHHLYLADLALRRGGARQGVLPPHDVVIFDEAHQLEEIATEFFGVRASTARVEAIVRDARRALVAAGAMALKGKPRGAAERDVGARLLDGVSDASQSLFAVLAAVIARPIGSEGGDSRSPLPVTAWSEEARGRLVRLDAALEAAAGLCKTHESNTESREALAAMGRRITSLRNDLTRISAPRSDDVPWIEVRARSCSIGLSPLELAPVLRAELFDRAARSDDNDPSGPFAIVLTSATLATGSATDKDPMRHAKRRLGVVEPARRRTEDDDLDDVAPRPSALGPLELVVGSPFDYRTKAGLYIPLDLPEPNAADFIERAGERIVELVRASRGGAFVLCASTRNMRAFHALLRVVDLPYRLLCQGDAPKTALLDEFRRSGDAVLVATMGFWEGVDVPGRALRSVIIDKLPFAVPSDPVVSARYRAIEERGGSAFAELSIPDAAIALKQGFGRLVRTRLDAGVVTVLDKRLRTKGYGKQLRASLPPASELRTLEDVRAFFELVVGVGDPS